MEDYQQRVIEEKDDLVKKLENLNKFIASPKFSEITATQRELLKCQRSHMRKYLQVLHSRLDNFYFSGRGRPIKPHRSA